MKIIVTNLSGDAAEGEHREPHGLLPGVMDESKPGFIRQIRIGAAGLQISHGLDVVIIPRAELFKLAEKALPALHPDWKPEPEAENGALK